MPHKFVVRLLDAAGALLAWTELRIAPSSGGRFEAPGPTPFLIELAGTAVAVSIYWSELDIARCLRLTEPFAVTVGGVLRLGWTEPVWAVPHDRDAPLPAVTVRSSIVVGPPAGEAGGKGSKPGGQG